VIVRVGTTTMVRITITFTFTILARKHLWLDKFAGHTAENRLIEVTSADSNSVVGSFLFNLYFFKI